MTENRIACVFLMLLHGGWAILALLATWLANGVILLPISAPVFGIFMFIFGFLGWPYFVIFITGKLEARNI